MARIYIALVDTPGIFAYLIRRFLKQKYIHVVISMDAELEEAYSFGRRNPFIPVIAGFEKENKEKILRAFPTAVLGLPFILCGRPFYQKNHYTCSSYIARLLSENGIQVSEKHFSLVTPKDFYEYPDKQVVFEGALEEIVHPEASWKLRKPEAVYEY